MYQRSIYEILVGTGQAVLTLTQPMQDEAELFASPLTLRAVEARLLIMAHTLGNLTPALHERLLAVDWRGWAALHECLCHGITPRREEIWYAIQALLPQTLAMLADLRQQRPEWFELGY